MLLLSSSAPGQCPADNTLHATPNATKPAASRLIFGHDFRISDAPAAAAVAAADWVQPLIHKSIQPSGGSINPSINAATVLGALCNSGVILRALRFHAVPKYFCLPAMSAPNRFSLCRSLISRSNNTAGYGWCGCCCLSDWCAAGWNEGINNRYQNSASFCWVKLLAEDKIMESDFSSLCVKEKDNRSENCKKNFYQSWTL